MRISKKNIIIFILFVLIVSFSFYSCARESNETETAEIISHEAPEEFSAKDTQEGDEQKDNPMEIVVTIPPLLEFVEAITGDKAVVTIMVPPGASPHTYEPMQSQLVSLSGASIYVKVGTPVEFEMSWLPKIKDMNAQMLIADCSKSIILIDAVQADKSENDHPDGEDDDHDHEGLQDPHIWLSLKNASIMVKNIYETVVEVDPSNKDYYKNNMEAYLKELEDLDQQVEIMFSGVENNKFMVYHDAWAYFARDYGLTPIPIEKDGKEPTPRGLKELIDQAKQEEIKVIFASPELNISSANVIAQEIGAVVVLISPLAQDYLENMRNISNEISKNLKK